jgi:predicted RNase H-like HicB family nuclease
MGLPKLDTPSCPWKKSSRHLWIEDSPLGRPVEKPRFSKVDGHRIQRCCTFTHSLLGDPMMFTAVYMPVPEGYIGFVEEIPGANSQGETLDEVRENLREAVQLVLEANRELAEQALAGKDVEREPFELAS